MRVSQRPETRGGDVSAGRAAASTTDRTVPAPMLDFFLDRPVAPVTLQADMVKLHCMTARTRRSFLGASALGLTGCAARHTASRAPLPSPVPAPGLARVKVSANRVIRTIVGLRPFRP